MYIVIQAEILQFPRFKSLNNCRDYRIQCNSSNEIPCCQENNVCVKVQKDLRTYTSICLKPLKLGDLCEENVDCLMLGHAKCDEGHCDCLTNYGIPNKGTKCLPLIGGICLEDDDCSVKNTICVNNKCQCRDKYLAINNNQCKPSTLGKKCRGDLNCNNELHMKCSENEICSCKSNHTMIDNIKCVPLLDEFCWTGEKCAVNNSICFKNKCQCIKDYKALGNYMCIHTDI
ncbi:uncharacterized protein LOC130675184 isoform X2 [Microplitis mediator]|uniref:uncharacterized protein LOC130675184 isoform X2 n=1 Tax=Microplitis mediator TaxID=375433 RepID=UPI002553B967|nr:uncharacterized protein LOC130675184 isoform X2 [Microplitis mediator]